MCYKTLVGSSAAEMSRGVDLREFGGVVTKAGGVEGKRKEVSRCCSNVTFEHQVPSMDVTHHTT